MDEFTNYESNMAMKHSRRSFIKSSALASASFLIPEFLKASALKFLPNEQRQRVLVIIQLSGGNDGLNCVVPLRNDIYHKSRPAIGLTEEELIRISDDAGLNSGLEGFAQLYDSGNAAIISSVGYPNPNRSHFRSMDIWQSASDENKYVTSGWIGRMLDATCSDQCTMPYQAIEIDDTLSLALKGEKMKGLAFHEPGALLLSSKNSVLKNVSSAYTVSPDDDHNVEFLHKTFIETAQSAEYIYQHSKIYSSRSVYPNHEFGKQMKIIAELIISGSATSVYYVSLPGFDTHVFQKGQHRNLLKVYGDALKAFCDDLKQNNYFNETMIMTFSEFGRRVAQNASKGTDHGTANNVFIAGGKLNKAGLINGMPDLADLDNGDLKYKTDFRSVYATLLNKWLGVNDAEILGGNFEKLSFV